MEIFGYPEGLDLLTRWIHIIAGITWIGLLYYFNFVQAPFFAETEAGVKSAATRQLVPRALAWFRYSALVTFLAGVILLLVRLDVFGAEQVFGSAYGFVVLTAGILGTIMFINVWAVIWPNQKIVIGSAQAVAGGGSADPRAEGATRRGMLASRTNVVLSIPMVFFMATSGHGGFLFRESTSGERWAYWLIFAGLLALIEGNALIGLTGALKKPLEKVGPVIASGFVLVVVLYVVLAVFAIL
ncbi:MAG TPA: urate hydroxylase PuuD [Actinomycetota bacterium]|nr:urate hydroxylase PuuD [Actinomycetota bacterium]